MKGTQNARLRLIKFGTSLLIMLSGLALLVVPGGSAKASTVASLLPSSPIAGYAYYVAGGGLTPVSPTGTPADKAANLGGHTQFDPLGNMYMDPTNYDVDMEPVVSGTYFGVSMTAGNVYQIAHSSGGPTNAGVGGSALSISGLTFILDSVDISDNVYLDFQNIMYMIPSVSGTYFGQSMQADYLYQIVGNGTSGDQQNDVPALSAEFGQPYFTTDSSGNIYVADGGNAVADMIPTKPGTYFGVSMQADYIYTVAGLNNGSACFSSSPQPATTSGTPALSTSLCNVGKVFVDGSGDVILGGITSSSSYTVDIPVASGTYYGLSMVAGDVYIIGGGPLISSSFTNGESASLMPGAFLSGIDRSGDLFFGTNTPSTGMVPEVSGTYFGKSMLVGQIYAVNYTGNRNFCSKFLIKVPVDALSNPSSCGFVGVDPDGNLYDTGTFWEGSSRFSYVVAIAESGSAGVPTGPDSIEVSSTSSSVGLNWFGAGSNGSEITDYKVLSEPIGSTTQTTNDTSSNALSYSLSSLTPGSSYELFVESVNSNGTSTEVLSPPITESATVPSAPTGVTTSSGNGSVNLTWTAPSSTNPISDYVVTVYPLVGSPIQFDTHSSTASYSVTGLTTGSIYSFEVTAENSSGYGASSTYVMAQVAGPPSAPAQPDISSVSGGVQVNWSPPQIDGGSPITGYEVVANQQGGPTTTSSPMTTTSYLESGLTLGDSYTFNVIAINAAGNSPDSPPSASITDGVPTYPDPVGAEGGSGIINVMWPTPSYIGASAVSDYIVTEYPGTGSPVVIDTGSTSNLLSLSGMNESTSYTFSIQAVNSYGDSLPSIPSNPTTPAAEPTAPPSQFYALANYPVSGEGSLMPAAPDVDQLGITGYQFNGCGYTNQPMNIEYPVVSGSVPCGTAPYPAQVSTVAGSYISPLYNFTSANQNVDMAPFVCDNCVGLSPISGGFSFSFQSSYNTNNLPGYSDYLITVNPSTGPSFTDYFNTSSFDITGLSANESYTFTIYLGNAYGWSLPYTTWDPTPGSGLPYAPSGLSAQAGNASATLNWSAGSDNGSAITDYLIVMPNGSTIDTKSTSTSYTVTGLTNGTSYAFKVEEENANGYSLPSSPSTPVTPLAPLNEYVPLSPVRIVDTRANSGYLGQGAILGPKSTYKLSLSGNFNIPSNATAVSLNVTVTDTTSSGFLVAYPDGASLPGSSNLNWQTSETKANLVQVTIGSDGMVDFYNPYGNADLIVDLEGYYAPSNSPSGLYQPITPTRVCDTRYLNNQCSSHTLTTSNESINVQMTGNAGIPSDAEAVVINLTATDTSVGGYLSASPTGSSTTSSLNWSGANDTASNRVIVMLSATGAVDISNFMGTTDLVVDVTGYFTGSTSTEGGASFTGVNPLRIADTRPGSGLSDQNTTLAPGASMTVTVGGANNVPSNAKSAVINVTVTNTGAPGYLSVTPTGGVLTSDVNWMGPNLSVPNIDVATLSSSGSITITNGSTASVDVIVDLFGYYS